MVFRRTGASASEPRGFGQSSFPGLDLGGRGSVIPLFRPALDGTGGGSRGSMYSSLVSAGGFGSGSGSSSLCPVDEDPDAWIILALPADAHESRDRAAQTTPTTSPGDSAMTEMTLSIGLTARLSSLGLARDSDDFLVREALSNEGVSVEDEPDSSRGTESVSPWWVAFTSVSVGEMADVGAMKVSSVRFVVTTGFN